jgi:diacylglycerol kinase (ATP)
LRESNAVIAIGGDGLVNLVLQEIVGGSKPLFVHAAGTGNDFHRHNFNKIRFVKEGFETKFIDLAKCSIDGGERLFGQALSAGFDSLVNRRANELRYLPGALKYVIALFLVLPRFRPVEYKLIIDGKDRNLKAMMVVVANGPTYGGGMKVLPFAKSDDGELDVLILHPVSKFTLIKVFPKVFIGQHIKHPKVEILKCKTIKIVADVPIYADGEYFGNGEVNIEILPSILPIIGSSWN